MVSEDDWRARRVRRLGFFAAMVVICLATAGWLLKKSAWVSTFATGLVTKGRAIASMRAGDNGEKAETDASQARVGQSKGLVDPAVTSLRRPAEYWRRSLGPRRRVVDQVWLVADAAEFLEAIAYWDEQYFFPILIDDPNSTLPFLRAFRPARVVRYQRPRDPTASDLSIGSESTREPREAAWSAAQRAVWRAWSRADPSATGLPALGSPPRHLGPTPPGVVLSTPDSPMLAGAVALAAGRFQPLVRLETTDGTSGTPGEPARPRTFHDVLSLTEAWQFARRVHGLVASLYPKASTLGDECDFLTIAGDWPYRYISDSSKDPFRGINAIDDLIGRILPRENTGDWLPLCRRRWAYTGRLLGDPKQSVARAMGALFLQPSSALCWDTYQGGMPWAEYAMDEAVDRLRSTLHDHNAVRHNSGLDANLTSWHRKIEPLNFFGLFLVNSSGGPFHFAITGGPGHPADLPAGVPTVVAMIHSFSAADPTDTQTIAGRWLDQGAFVYFGSVHEPYLLSFRTPRLVAELIAAGMPLVAALRQGENEEFGFPWRLAYLGDPLYQIDPVRGVSTAGAGAGADRISATDWGQLSPDRSPAHVIEVTATPAPPSPIPDATAAAAEADRLRWCLDAAIRKLTASALPSRATAAEETARQQSTDWRLVLRMIRRDQLDPRMRSILDHLMIHAMRETGEFAELSARLAAIPPSECGLYVWQALERCATARLAGLAREQNSTDVFGRALEIWNEVMCLEWPTGSRFPGQLTERIAAMAAAGPRRHTALWRDRLTRTGKTLASRPGRFPHADAIAAEEKRLDAAYGSRSDVLK